jgi:hypothetical protein
MNKRNLALLSLATLVALSLSIAAILVAQNQQSLGQKS